MKEDFAEHINSDKSVIIENKTMALCEFQEQISKNIVVAMFRIDKLNFGEDEKFRSGVVKFFQKLGAPLQEDKYPASWKDHFIIGMRFRGRVVTKTELGKDGVQIIKYYLDVSTVRKLLQSDKQGEIFN